MRYLIIVFCGFLLSCDRNAQEEIITGELYFSEFRIGSYYNLDDSVRVGFEQALDTLRTDRVDSSALNIIEAYYSLKLEGLLYKPYVDLRQGNNSLVKLYLDSTDYERIKVYKWKRLRDEGKKVVVKARTVKIKSSGIPLRYCVALLAVDLEDGQTLPERSKFKIEDYN